MRIKTNLTLLILTFVMLIITIGFIMFMTFGQINREVVHYNDISEISKGVSELSIVTHEYFMNHEKRMLQQWLQRYNSMGRLLEKAEKEEVHPGHLPILKSITSDYKILGDLFSQLQANLTKRKRLIKENRPQNEIDVTFILEERVMAHTLMRVQKITSEVFKFSAIMEESVKRVQQRANLMVLFSIIGFVILSSCISFLVIRAVTRPLNELVKSTEIIGKGDLEHRVDIKTKNEIGELAVAFNRMTENLKKVTASRDELNKEIIERKKAEEALRRTAEEWGTTFESITDMVSIHDKDFKIVRANKSLTDTFNMKPEEIIGKNCYELMHGTKEPPSFCPHKQALETGKPHCTEVFEPHLGIYIQISVSPIFDENGRTIATAHITKDITERKRVEEQIWRKTAVVEAINNVFQETLVCETEEQVAHTCIKMAEELTGSKYGLIGEVNETGRFDTISYGDLGWAICKMPESEAISLSKNMELRGIWAQAILKEKSQIANNPTSHPDSVGTPEGHPPITSFLGVPLQHAGKTIGMIGLANKEGGYGPVDQEAVESLSVAFVEALHRKRAEVALRESKSKYKLLLESLPQKIFLKDRNSVYISCNENYARDLKIKPEEIAGKTDCEFYPKELAEKYRRDDKRIMEAGKVEDLEEKYIRDGQEEAWVHTVKTPVRDDQDKVIGILGIFWDITERRKAEEEKTTLKAQLHQTQKMEAIGTLAGGIAHDFNNILTAMVGYADLALEDAREGTVAQNNLQQVLMAGSRAKELVRQILTFSRKTDQEQEPMEIAPIVKEALKMLRSSIPTIIEIRQNIQANSSVIMANPTEIHQILVNLCTNATHAMGENGGLLEVSLTNVVIEPAIVTDFGTLQEGSYLKLSVKDTGCGMNREVMGRIFEPFFTTKDVGKGTGMGLSMVHGIIESYGGLITVDSEPGNGTTFNVFFPRIESSITQLSEPSEIVFGQGEMILLVDDEKPIVDMMTQMLERLGYTVVGKTDSIDALKTFRAEPDKFDLVITDYAMPNRTGKQLAKELISIRPDIPIILCTGFNDDIDAEGAKSIGVKEFIMKPIDRKNIAVIIRNILDKKEIRV